MADLTALRDTLIDRANQATSAAGLTDAALVATGTALADVRADMVAAVNRLRDVRAAMARDELVDAANQATTDAGVTDPALPKVATDLAGRRAEIDAAHARLTLIRTIDERSSEFLAEWAKDPL